MKVAIFSTRFAFEYSIELSNSLSRQKAVSEVILLLPGNKLDSMQIEQINPSVKFIPYYLPRHREFLKNCILLKKILRILEREKPEVLHLQGSANSYFFMIIPFIFNRLRIVDTIHDAMPHPGYDNIRHLIMRKTSLKYVDRWFIHGNSLKNLFTRKNNVNPGLVSVIPKGHYEIFSNYSDIEVTEKPSTILFFGNITKYKGLIYLIKAEPLVSKVIPSVNIIIAGRSKGGDNFSIYEKKMVNKDKYILKNYRIPIKDIPILFKKCSCVVLPYIEASQSGIIPIAYAFKKPVIVTNVGGLPEMVVNGKTGIIVKPRSAISLAAAIIKMLSDEKMRISMGIRGYEYAMTELSWDKIARQTVSVYSTLVKR